ncbi:hypothetical protein [Actinacidiphila yeochonensis]|uniref:hypothetical protein n=1 Tax=Actinacidiphila yeochonensis TaxID=89050 RepID=UPI00068F4838|nr:hypothetical protein [Actinacidiphila yeochonensis]
MTGSPARVAAAAVFMAAAAALAGCGSAHHTEAARPTAAASSTASSSATAATPTATAPPAERSPSVGPDGTAESVQPSPGPTVPAARLTPATGTFTGRQKDYLAGKVHVGQDPSSVLEDGQDVCERIALTARTSPSDAKAAISSGELPSAKDAITYLCPRYAYLLK